SVPHVALQQPSADRRSHPRAAGRHPLGICRPLEWPQTGQSPGRGVLSPPSVVFAILNFPFRVNQLEDPHPARAAGGARIALRTSRTESPEGIVKEEDFDIPMSKLADSAERVVDRAIDEAR